jgi:hypothetical protein
MVNKHILLRAIGLGNILLATGIVINFAFKKKKGDI